MNRTAGRYGLVATVLNIIGLGLAIYLTVEHYSTSPSFACPETGTVNCVKVTTSSYSTFLGVPVVLAGLVFFVVSIGLHLPAAWRSPKVWLTRARWAWAVIGMISVFYLIYGELSVGAICLYCTGVHIVTFLLLVITAIGSAALIPDEDLIAGDDE